MQWNIVCLHIITCCERVLSLRRLDVQMSRCRIAGINHISSTHDKKISADIRSQVKINSKTNNSAFLSSLVLKVWSLKYHDNNHLKYKHPELFL